MFFRVVTTKYKDKEYQYLKLLESYRNGENIKHRVFMNITNLNQMDRDQADGLIQELQQILALGKTFRQKKFLGPRLMDIVFLLAAEYSLKPKVFCNDKQIKKMLTEKKKRNYHLIKTEGIAKQLRSIASLHSSTDKALFWVQASNKFNLSRDEGLGILFNCQGFILGYLNIDMQDEQNSPEEFQQIIKDSKDIPVLHSIIYEAAFPEQVNYNLENVSEIELTSGFGKHNAKETKKLYVINHPGHRQCNEKDIYKSISEINHSQNWFNKRLQPALKENGLDGEAMVDLWTVAHTFYKLINQTAQKFKINKMLMLTSYLTSYCIEFL